MRRVPLNNVTLELLQRKANGTAKEMQELSEPCDLNEVDFFITSVNLCPVPPDAPSHLMPRQ